MSPLIHSRNYIESPIKEIKQSQEIHKKENNKELENKKQFSKIKISIISVISKIL